MSKSQEVSACYHCYFLREKHFNDSDRVKRGLPSVTTASIACNESGSHSFVFGEILMRIGDKKLVLNLSSMTQFESSSTNVRGGITFNGDIT